MDGDGLIYTYAWTYVDLNLFTLKRFFLKFDQIKRNLIYDKPRCELGEPFRPCPLARAVGRNPRLGAVGPPPPPLPSLTAASGRTRAKPRWCRRRRGLSSLSHGCGGAGCGGWWGRVAGRGAWWRRRGGFKFPTYSLREQCRRALPRRPSDGWRSGAAQCGALAATSWRRGGRARVGAGPPGPSVLRSAPRSDISMLSSNERKISSAPKLTVKQKLN
jgi:hypothetical protein